MATNLSDNAYDQGSSRENMVTIPDKKHLPEIEGTPDYKPEIPN